MSRNVVSCTQPASQGNDFQLIPAVQMESQHSVGAPTSCDFPRFVIILQISRPEVGGRLRRSRKSWLFFGKERPLTGKFSKTFPKGFTTSQIHVLCANFVKFGWPEIGKVVCYLQDKKISARCPALASAWIAPKICQDQLQTIYSEYPKCHPNLFTSSGVIAGHVNIVETRQKVFPILGEASSWSKNALSIC